MWVIEVQMKVLGIEDSYGITKTWTLLFHEHSGKIWDKVKLKSLEMEKRVNGGCI